MKLPSVNESSPRHCPSPSHDTQADMSIIVQDFLASGCGPLFAAELTPFPTFCWFCDKTLSFEATFISKASLFVKLLRFEN